MARSVSSLHAEFPTKGLPPLAFLVGAIALLMWIASGKPWPVEKAMAQSSSISLMICGGTLAMGSPWAIRLGGWLTGIVIVLAPDLLSYVLPSAAVPMSSRTAVGFFALAAAMVCFSHGWRWAAQAFGLAALVYSCFYLLPYLIGPFHFGFWRPGVALPATLGIGFLGFHLAFGKLGTERRDGFLQPALVAIALGVLSLALWQSLRFEENLRIRRIQEKFPGASSLITRTVMPEVTLVFGLLTTGLAALAVGMAQRAREREQAARPAEEAKARFLANMSHEIRTPLNGVLGMTDLLLTTDIDDEQKEYLNTIRHSSTSLLAILSDILDFSKLEAGKVSLENMAFDPAMEVRDALRLLQNGFAEKGLELRLDLQDLPRKVEGDALRLRQIVLHLAGNALKFTERGSVQIEGRRAGENKLRFRVIDSGCGVPKEAWPKLFDSFTQADASTKRRYGGTGLGLAISRRLAHLMGGDLGLEEMADGSPGSVFWFEIAVRIIPEPKAAAVPTAEVPSPVKKNPASPSGARILVAEDNEVNQRIVESFLTRMGFQVDTAANGREAVAAVTARSYGLILMDVQMPDLDGLEATAAIRRLELEAVATAASPGGENRIPIIALTANAMSGDRDRCLAAGMDDYLSKPVSADEMEAKVRQWLDAGRVTGIQALQTAVGMPSSADRSLHS